MRYEGISNTWEIGKVNSTLDVTDTFKSKAAITFLLSVTHNEMCRSFRQHTCNLIYA